jgi:RND family efflux transporter MFP subunit
MTTTKKEKSALQYVSIGSVVASFTRPVLLGCLVLLAAGCGRHTSQPKQAPPSVTVAPVERKEIVEWDEVRPRVSGYIQDVRFQSGQLVKKGDVLFQIDPRWHQAAFDQRQAEFDQARVHLENAHREADRTSQLLANKAISVEESDARQSRYQEAKAAGLAAQAALDSARLDFEYTQVRAPIDGRVSRALLTAGNYVSGLAGGATLLTTIVSVDPVYVYAEIDENSFLKFDALATAKKVETNGDGKVPIDLQLADEPEFPHHGYLVPGLFARIRIPVSERHSTLLVEERAIGTDQAQKFVLTLTTTNTVAYQSVKLGPAVEGKRIVRSGLQGTEAIVVNGLQRVRPGMPVTPQQEIADGDARHLATR